MNHIILIGRLTKDPELRYTQSGKAVAQFTLAVDRVFGENETDFFNIVVWNKPAENAAKYLQKGSKCAVEGNLQNRSYDAKDGTKRYVTEIIASRVEFLDSKKASQEDFGTEVIFDDEDVPF